MEKENSQFTGLEIAIIGMSGRFPGAANLEQFWHNLKHGVESITFFTDKQLEAAGVSRDMLQNPDYVKAKGLLQDYDCFDASFFDYVPADAELLDPQIRLFHECAWEALEEGGYALPDSDLSVGVYAGASSNLLWEATASLTELAPESKQFADSQLTDKDFLSTRVSYALNLKGPSVSIYTACSTSLVAIHMACQGLLSGECRMALAGGVTVSLPQEGGYLFQEGMILSPDGHCRAFDHQAAGTVGGSGAGVVLLKRLEDALADGDPIHALIKGSAINNDGAGKAAFSAPSIEEQSRVIRSAMLAAEVEPDSISYVEAHGTGTYIGDPVELEGLRLAFDGVIPASCAIGSVKSNIGHLDCAAGVAGFIKTVLALKHRTLPPTLHVTRPNPQFDWNTSPFYVNTQERPWTSDRGHPLRVGVSSFGIGGTNAHVILEQAPPVAETASPRHRGKSMDTQAETSPVLLPLSAKTPAALKQTAENLARYLAGNPHASLEDVAHTLVHARAEWKHRAAFICHSRLEAIEQLYAFKESGTPFPAAGFMEEVRERWLAGDSIRRHYSHLFAGSVLHLPTYPFAKVQFNRQLERYKQLMAAGSLSAHAGDHEGIEQEARPQKNADLSKWLYVPGWSRTSRVSYMLDKRTIERLKESMWVIAPDACGISGHILKLLEEHNAEVLVTGPDAAWTLPDSNTKPLKILHLASLAPEMHPTLDQARFQALQQNGAYRLLDHVRNVHKVKGTVAADLIAVTNGMQEVTGTERIQAAHSTLKGLALVIPQENPNIRCTVVDLDDELSAEAAHTYACALLSEAVRIASSPEPFVAYRKQYRWIANYAPAPLPARLDGQSELRPGGIYCITGGFGKIGRALAEHFALRYGARVALLGRTVIPDRHTWKDMAAGQMHDAEERVRSLIGWAQTLEQSGAEIILLTADVACEDSLGEAFARVGEHWGPINGIIHAAGLTDGTTFEAVSRLDEERLEEQFRSKVYGMLALERAVADLNPDFCVLFSSLSAVLGGITFGAYAAANSFLDACVYSPSFQQGRWISLGWDGWNVGGEHDTDSAADDPFLMEMDEGIEVLERVLLTKEAGHFIVSVANLEQRRSRWVTGLRVEREQAAPVRSNIRKLARPPLAVPYSEPENELQRQLTDYWGNFFGIEPIGIDDDFFELGGDSLKGATLIAGLQKQGLALPLSELFQHSTIRELADIWTGESAIASTVAQGDPEPESELADLYPLSPAQTRMYFMSRYYEQDTNYNIPSAVTIDGPLDKVRVEQTIRSLIRRHESLRTSFEMRGEEPVQRIHPASEIRFDLAYSEAALEQIEARAHELIQPFDLGQAPLLRAQLIRLEENRHLLFMDMHHIISDGVSTGIIMKEFVELYDGKVLEEPTHQYKDYVRWLQGISPSVRERQQQFWLNRYRGELPALRLPVLMEPGQGGKTDADKLPFILDQDTVRKLQALSSRHRSTMFMTLLTLYYVFLSRYTNQQDIVIGTASAGRQYEHADNIVGMFVNTLPLRNFPAGSKRFTDFLEEVKSNVLQSFDHQEYPFEELLQQLDLERSPDRQPLMETMFVFQNIDFHAQSGSLTFAGYDLPSTSSKYDLMLEAKEMNGEILCLFHYRVQCFDRAYVQQMGRHFQHLVQQCLADPELELRQLRLMTSEEEVRLLQLTHPYLCESTGQTVQSRFEAMAERYPDRIALVLEDSSYTYRVLNEQANRVAHTLLSNLPRQEAIVAIVMERSEQLVSAILGTVKAGAAYLLIQPDLPEERIAYMLKDSEAARIITTPEHAGRLKGYGPELLLMQVDNLAACMENPAMDVLPDRLAYVMYTSGTTGKPKAVMIENRNIARLVLPENYRLLIQGDRVLQTASMMFDAFTLELWGTLTNGDTLVMLNEHIIQDARTFSTALSDYAITDLFLTTSLFHYLVMQQPSSFATLKTVIIGGEAASAHHAQLLHQACPDTVLINGYGPTENTTFSTLYTVKQGTKAPVPIGVPLYLSQAYVVHPEQMNQLQPPGVEGELCVAGQGVGRGYWKQPEMTARKFVPNPFDPGKLMYRTGDFAKWLPDGTLQFIGRMDDQVKIRGYRIELDEIRACMLEHPDITGAAVIVLDREAGREKEICAYYTAGQAELAQDQVRSFLAARLPRYMVPAFVICLDILPLTSNGKLDQRALPDPRTQLQDSAALLTEPVTAMERRLAAIFAAVLELNTVGRDCNFFDWGGHSLKAMQLVSRVQQEFNLEMKLKDLFRYPVLQELALHLEERAEHATEEQEPLPWVQSIQPAMQKEEYPLSSAQQRLFILEQFQDIGTSYNMPFVLRLEGELDIERVKFVYTSMLGRHAALRTSFHLTEDRGPVQKVAPVESLQAEVTLYSCEPEERQAVHDLIQQFVRPFALDVAPLVRVGIVRLQARRHLLMVDMHHLISDGVSMDIWVDEFIRLYTNDNALEAPRLQYPDYAVWQQQQLHSGILERQKAFWLNQLASPLPVLQMPTDYARPAVRNYAGRQYSFTLGQELTNKLRSCSREHGVTLYMLTLAAYGVLLHQYAGQDDLVIGTPVAGRNHADLFGVVGMFANTLAIRCQPEPGKTATDFLQEIKHITLHAFEHADYPFEELVQALNVPRDTSRSPVFDTMFSLQNAPSRTLQLPGLSCEPYGFETNQSAFDLSLQIHEQQDRLELFMEYSTRLFREDTIHRLMCHYCNILQFMVTQPEALLSTADMLTYEEKHLILQQFNSTAIDREQPAMTLSNLVERQAAQTPNRLAVHHGEEQLTYRELMQKGDMLARHLTELGVTEGRTVAILMSNSSAMIVALLAIQRMGAICVPIDPEYPEKRITFMLQDANTVLLITGAETGVPLAWTGPTLRMSGSEAVGSSLEQGGLRGGVSDTWPETGMPGDALAWLPDRSQPGSIAYVLYTSGTTGQPKGVQLSHRNLAHYVTTFSETFHLEPDDRVLHHSSISFDTSIEEIYPALITGGSVHIAAKDKARHIESLAALIEERSVTVISASPLMLSELDRHLRNHRVRLFIAGGDVLKKQHVSRLLQNAEVYNSYGPTETTVCAAYHRCQDSDGDSMPIGKPIPGCRIYILNRSGQLQPPGIPGELCIAGAGVTQGYLGREDLTAERFIPDPHGPGRMYRTGDLAKWDEQGNLHFLGRMDQQVKIRGYRVELQEIETALLQIPGVQEAVVLARADQHHFKRLQAFLVSDIQQYPEQIRERLLLELPEYMIPSQFIVLDHLPLTHNGKVDRRQLEQEHEHIQAAAQEARAVEPSNPVEARLHHIWKEVLNVDELSVQDNFFERGGHSLKATSLAVKIRHEFRLDFNLQHVFQYQTIAEMADFLKSSLAVAQLDDIVPAQQADHYPLSSAQKRMLLLHAADETSTSYNMPMVLEVAGKLDEERCRAALAQLIGRHEILRTSFHFIDGLPVQNIHARGAAEWIEIEAEQDEVHAIIQEHIRPFRLDMPTQLRVCLIHTGEHQAVLVFDIHHIISDGVSLSILITEFMDIYMGKELPALQVQYKDFAVWQNEMLSSPQMLTQKNYWLAQFEDEAPALKLPYDYERPKLQSFSGSSISFEAGAELNEQLKRLALRTDTTLYMLLLAAYYTLLYRYSGQRDIVIGCPIAGRQHEQVERLLGMFVNTLPLRMRIHGDCRFEDLLHEVRQRTLAGYAHQDYPFDDLVEQLDYRRDLSRNPLFDTVLVMQNMESPPTIIPDTQFQARDYERNSTMFDIRFEVTEDHGGLQFTMDYCTSLFKASTIRHMTRNYMHILQQIVRNAGVELDRIELEHGYTIRERQDWLESITFDF